MFEVCSLVQMIDFDLLLCGLTIPDTEQTTSLLCAAGIRQVEHSAPDRKSTLASCHQENVQLDVIGCANAPKKKCPGVSSTTPQRPVTTTTTSGTC